MSLRAVSLNCSGLEKKADKRRTLKTKNKNKVFLWRTLLCNTVLVYAMCVYGCVWLMFYIILLLWWWLAARRRSHIFRGVFRGGLVDVSKTTLAQEQRLVSLSLFFDLFFEGHLPSFSHQLESTSAHPYRTQCTASQPASQPPHSENKIYGNV